MSVSNNNAMKLPLHKDTGDRSRSPPGDAIQGSIPEARVALELARLVSQQVLEEGLRLHILASGGV